MVGKTKRPTASQKKRLSTIKEHIPCIACLLAQGRPQLPEIHHLVSGFKRLGHDHTIPLCSWHHRGLKANGYSTQQMMGIYGPALANGKSDFIDFFGPESLLVTYTNRLLASFDAAPWMDYYLPDRVRIALQHDWAERRAHGFVDC